MKQHLLRLFTLFLWFYFTAADPFLTKRQAVASLTCANQNNSVSICSPAIGDTWYNGSYHEFTWKFNNPVYTDYDTVDLYLLYENDGNYQPQKQWSGLPRTSGVLVQQVDDTWFPSQLPENSPNRTWTVYAYLIAPGYDYQTEIAKQVPYFPVPVQFNLIQNARNSTTNGSSPASTESDNSSSGNGLAGWMIAVIVVACVVFLAAVAALLWLLRRMRKNRQDAAAAGGEQRTLIVTDIKNADTATNSPGDSPATTRPFSGSLTNASTLGADNRDMASISSSTPIIAHGGSQRGFSTIRGMNDMEKSPTAAQHIMQQQEARQSSSILSSTDALMIADTFRQFMRKPEWNEHHEEEEDIEAGLESDDRPRPQQQQQQQPSEQLMREQIANEGATVQQVPTRSKTPPS